MKPLSLQAKIAALVLSVSLANVNAQTSDVLHVPSPDWREQIIYFVMLDRFNDGDTSNNNQGVGEYDPGRNSHYSGGDLPGLVQGFLRACWVQDLNIADDAVIRDLLEAHGFDPKLADSGLFTGAETYGRNLEQAVAAGAFGAPFYVVRETDQRFWGQDRLDFLDRHLAAQ